MEQLLVELVRDLVEKRRPDEGMIGLAVKEARAELGKVDAKGVKEYASFAKAPPAPSDKRY